MLPAYTARPGVIFGEAPARSSSARNFSPTIFLVCQLFGRNARGAGRAMTQRAFGHLRPGNIGQQVDFADTATAYRNDDVPIKAKLARQQVLHFMDPDILQRKKQPWNNGTKPSGPYPFDHGPLNKGMPFAPRFPDPSAKRSLHVGTSIKPEIDQRAEKIPKRDPIMPRKTSKLQFDPRRLQHSTLPSNLGGTAAAQPRTDTTLPPVCLLRGGPARVRSTRSTQRVRCPIPALTCTCIHLIFCACADVFDALMRRGGNSPRRLVSSSTWRLGATST